MDKGIHQKHDKSFKFILSSKKEMSEFLRQFIGFNIEGEMLEEQKNKLIDINKYTKNDLIRKNTKMSSMLLIEKCKTKEELIDILMSLIVLIEDQERIEWLEKNVEYVIPDVLGEDKEEILKILKGKEKEEMNDEWFETIKRNEAKKENELKKQGRKEGRKQGKKETILEIIKNMLTLNQDAQTIMKFTKAKKSDIEEVKKELQMQV